MTNTRCRNKSKEAKKIKEQKLILNYKSSCKKLPNITIKGHKSAYMYRKIEVTYLQPQIELRIVQKG